MNAEELKKLASDILANPYAFIVVVALTMRYERWRNEQKYKTTAIFKDIADSLQHLRSSLHSLRGSAQAQLLYRSVIFKRLKYQEDFNNFVLHVSNHINGVWRLEDETHPKFTYYPKTELYIKNKDISLDVEAENIEREVKEFLKEIEDELLGKNKGDL